MGGEVGIAHQLFTERHASIPREQEGSKDEQARAACYSLGPPRTNGSFWSIVDRVVFEPRRATRRARPNFEVRSEEA